MLGPFSHCKVNNVRTYLIVRNSQNLAESVVEQVGIAPLQKCLSEPETGLKRIAVNCLNQLVKHSDRLTGDIIKNNNNLLTQIIACLFETDDPLLKRQTLICLANIAKHQQFLAQKVIKRLDFDKLLQLLLQEDLVVKVSYTILRNIFIEIYIS